MKPGSHISEVLTPQPVIDEDVMAANISRVQGYFDSIGRKFRPHIKTHKIPALAWAQVEAGAVGINCQKLSEAEVFAEAGFEDILITFNLIGDERLERLRALNERCRLSVVADNVVVVEGLAAAFGGKRRLTVLVECETGMRRNGVLTPGAAVDLARAIVGAEGLRFGGLMTYPTPHSEERIEEFYSETMRLLEAEGIACPVRTVGGTPSLFAAEKIKSATEHRAGTYIYNDRAMVRAGHCGLEDCAMHILAMVVSVPEKGRFVLDVGSKGLTSDLSGFADYGVILEYPEARIVKLSEEHGVVELDGDGPGPSVGERVRIVPNHTCVVSNLFDSMVFHRGGVVTRVEKVAARGRVW